MLSCNVFQIFHKNLLLSCPYYVKKVNSVKTTKYYEPKKSIGCPIFFKNVHSLKNNAFMPIFCQNRYVYSLKNKRLSCNFFKFCMKNPLVVMSKFGKKKRQFWLNYTVYGPTKSTVCHFFPFSLEKSMLSCPYFAKRTSSF